MQILVINSGSSSIKFQVIEMPSTEVKCSGLVERIGLENAVITYKVNGEKHQKTMDIPNHKVGLELVAGYLLDSEVGVIESKDDIDAVGHRVVHGGSTFAETVLIDENVKAKIKELYSLAPLHNPANLEGILVSENIFSSAKQVAVFDTSFHQTMPQEAYKYAIDNKFLEEHKIRAYGFHGTSHKFVTEKAREVLGAQNSKKLISVHLGNGCSITAVKDGKSIDHSMGFGPMNGLVMGTRCGDIDPAVVLFMIEKLGYSLEETSNILQKQSGMLGLTGYSDMRDIEGNAEKGDKKCQAALDQNTYRIKKFIGSYISVLNGVDAIIFTAGVGENSDVVRKAVCADMDFFGIKLNEEKNATRSGEIREIQANDSKVKVLVVPTDEELEIAKQTFELV